MAGTACHSVVDRKERRFLHRLTKEESSAALLLGGGRGGSEDDHECCGLDGECGATHSL